MKILKLWLLIFIVMFMTDGCTTFKQDEWKKLEQAENAGANVTISGVGSNNTTPASTSYVELETSAGVSEHATVGNLAKGMSIDTIADGTTYQKVHADEVNAAGRIIRIFDYDDVGAFNFTGSTAYSRGKTLRDADDTILELGGSYTPTGTWTSLTLVTPALGTPASGTLTNCTFPNGLNSINGLTETAGGMPYGTADNTYAWLAAGTEGKLMRFGAASAPTWSTLTMPDTITAMSVFAATSANVLAEVTSGGNNYILGSNSGNTGFEFKSPSDVLTQIGAEPEVTAGSLTNKVIMLEDLADEVNKLVTTQATTGAADVVEITGYFNDYERYLVVVSSDTDNQALTIYDTDNTPPNFTILTIQNGHANTLTMVDVPGQQELVSSATLEIGESITVFYHTDRWYELFRATNNLGFSVITTTETEFIPVGYMIDGASAPDALATLTSGTDKVNARTFAGDADEDLVFDWQVPLDCDVTSGIKFRVICIISSATGPSSETWQFELQGFTLGDGDALDGTLGTAQTSNSGSRTDAQYDRVATAWSAAMTSTHITDLAVGETAQFKLYRDIDDTDTYAQVVAVVGIEFKYKRFHNATF